MNKQGLFGIAADHTENHQSLDERFIKSKHSTFFFEAASESMSPYIEKGDVLIVDRSLTPTNNQIIIAAFSGELLCRRLFFSKEAVLLISDNEKFKTIQMTTLSDFIVWGVVKALARDVL